MVTTVATSFGPRVGASDKGDGDGVSVGLGVAEAVAGGSDESDWAEVEGKLGISDAAHPANWLMIKVPIANLNVTGGCYRWRTAATLRLSVMTEKVVKVAV